MGYTIPCCSTACQRKLLPPDHYLANIDLITRQNKYYLRTLFTTQQMQLVVRYISPSDGGLPEEVHEYSSQFIRIEEGEGYAIINGKRRELKTGDVLMVAPGERHTVVTDNVNPLRLYGIYSPPVHPRDASQLRRDKQTRVQ